MFDKATELCSGTKAVDALNYLHTLYDSLKTLGLGDKLIVDLGLVQRNDYYTGFVFADIFQA